MGTRGKVVSLWRNWCRNILSDGVIHRTEDGRTNRDRPSSTVQSSSRSLAYTLPVTERDNVNTPDPPEGRPRPDEYRPFPECQ